MSKISANLRNIFSSLIHHSSSIIIIHYHRFAVAVRRRASQLGVHGLDAHGLNTERARLAGGTSLHTAQVHTASAQNVQDQPGTLRFARGFIKSACYLWQYQVQMPSASFASGLSGHFVSLVVSKISSYWTLCGLLGHFSSLAVSKKCLLPMRISIFF